MLFRFILESKDMVRLDRVHCALGPKPTDLRRPLDVICRLHYFSQKEVVVRRTQSLGTIQHAGAEIHILTDLSRAMLQRRATLRCLLDALRASGFSYRWGYPFHLLVRKGSDTFCSPVP